MRQLLNSALIAASVAGWIIFGVAVVRADADVPPVATVVLHGDAGAMGTEHGEQLAAPIRLLHEKYLDVMIGPPKAHARALGAAKVFEHLFRPEHLAEVNAMAVKTGMDLDEAALAQCFLDLTPMSACSTVNLPADASRDHVARFGRDLDFPALNVADKNTTLFIYEPSDGRYAFASIGWPGMVGVLSGMNEYGLAIASMEVKRPARAPSAMPYTLLYRTLLERCKTVEDAIAMLEKTPRQTANNLMLADASGSRAVVEINPSGIVVRRGADGVALISTNHQRGQDADTAGRCRRYDFLHDSSSQQFGKIDVEALEKMLAGSSQGDMTLQSMIFEPANRVIYLSSGKNAARGEFHRVELKSYFDKHPNSDHASR